MENNVEIITDNVREYTVPLSQYAIIHESDNVHEAVMELEKSHSKFKRQDRYKHRSILVENQQGDIIGKLTERLVLKALEPNYDDIGTDDSLSAFGLTSSYMKSQMPRYDLWQKPLDDICKKADTIIAKDIMVPISKAELIDEGASLNQAIHQLVMTDQKILIVTKNNKAIGVLRLGDVFIEICLLIKTCELTENS